MTIPAPDVPLRHWSTRDVAEDEAFDYWRQVICSAFVPLRPTPLEAPAARFRGRVDTRALGVATVSSITADAQHVERRPDDGDLPQGTWFVNVQLAGTSHVAQGARHGELRPGDAVLLDAQRPFRMRFTSSFRQICVHLPDWYVREMFGHTRDLAGRPCRATPLTAVLTSYLETLTGRWDAAADDPASVLALSQVVGLLRTAVTGQVPSDGPSERAIRILAEIRAAHRDPSLSAAAVARRLAISERSLHAALGVTGRSFTRHLREVRLASVERTLAASSGTVVDAAHAAGFGDVSTYYRARRQTV